MLTGKLLELGPQSTFSDYHEPSGRIARLHTSHGADQVFTTLLFHQPADKQDHWLARHLRVRSKEVSVNPNVMDNHFSRREALLHQPVFYVIGNRHEHR